MSPETVGSWTNVTGWIQRLTTKWTSRTTRIHHRACTQDKTSCLVTGESHTQRVNTFVIVLTQIWNVFLCNCVGLDDYLFGIVIPA
jgi:hypothetical protein